MPGAKTKDRTAKAAKHPRTGKASGHIKRLIRGVSQAFSHHRTSTAQMSEELRTAVSRFVRDEYLPTWLRTPNPMLEGRTPAELLKLGREDLILKAIKTARHGEP